MISTTDSTGSSRKKARFGSIWCHISIQKNWSCTVRGMGYTSPTTEQLCISPSWMLNWHISRLRLSHSILHCLDGLWGYVDDFNNRFYGIVKEEGAVWVDMTSHNDLEELELYSERDGLHLSDHGMAVYLTQLDAELTRIMNPRPCGCHRPSFINRLFFQKKHCWRPAKKENGLICAEDLQEAAVQKVTPNETEHERGGLEKTLFQLKIHIKNTWNSPSFISRLFFQKKHCRRPAKKENGLFQVSVYEAEACCSNIRAEDLQEASVQKVTPNEMEHERGGLEQTLFQLKIHEILPRSSADSSSRRNTVEDQPRRRMVSFMYRYMKQEKHAAATSVPRTCRKRRCRKSPQTKRSMSEEAWNLPQNNREPAGN